MAKWGEIKCNRCEELEDKLAQQDDLVQAAVAAALREAAQAIQGDEMLSPIGAHRVSARILTLIPEDAQAALDRVVAEVLTQAADAVEDYCSDAPDLAGHGHSGAIRDVITALITEDAQAALDRVVQAERERIALHFEAKLKRGEFADSGVNELENCIVRIRKGGE